jgi:hypothetical protein
MSQLPGVGSLQALLGGLYIVTRNVTVELGCNVMKAAEYFVSL